METKSNKRVATYCRRIGVASVVTVGALAVPAVAGAAPPDPTLPTVGFDVVGDEITQAAGDTVGFFNGTYVPAFMVVALAGLAFAVGRKLFKRLRGAV